LKTTLLLRQAIRHRLTTAAAIRICAFASRKTSSSHRQRLPLQQVTRQKKNLYIVPIGCRRVALTQIVTERIRLRSFVQHRNLLLLLLLLLLLRRRRRRRLRRRQHRHRYS
jgi:hypothetical protein